MTTQKEQQRRETIAKGKTMKIKTRGLRANTRKIIKTREIKTPKTTEITSKTAKLTLLPPHIHTVHTLRSCRR